MNGCTCGRDRALVAGARALRVGPDVAGLRRPLHVVLVLRVRGLRLQPKPAEHRQRQAKPRRALEERAAIAQSGREHPGHLLRADGRSTWELIRAHVVKPSWRDDPARSLVSPVRRLSPVRMLRYSSTISAVTMPNMPCSLSAWVRMWQWKAQTPGSVASTMRLEALAGRDVERVAHVRLRQQVAVLGDDRHRHPVQVHRVDHQPFVHVADEIFSPFFAMSGWVAGKPLPLRLKPPIGPSLSTSV